MHQLEERVFVPSVSGEGEEAELLLPKKCSLSTRWKAASVGTINEYGELFAHEAHHTDGNDYDEEIPAFRKRRPTTSALTKRSSIFDADALEALQEAMGKKTTEVMITTVWGITFQATIFAFAALESALYPMLLEWTLWDERLEMKNLNFLPPVMYALYYASSALVGYVLTLLMGHSVKQTAKGVTAMIPLAVMLVVVEHMDCFAMVLVSPSVKSVVSQVRLPAVVLLGVFVFGRRQSVVQWCLIMGVVSSVVGFALASRSSGANSVEMKGPLLVFVQSVLTAGVYAITELTLHKVKQPFSLQMAQSRTVATVICSAAAAASWLAMGKPPLLQGFNRRTWVCIVGLVMRDWSQTFILKTLNSVWKALSAGLAVCITYATEVLCWGRPLDPVLLCFVLTTVVEVFGYSFSKL